MSARWWRALTAGSLSVVFSVFTIGLGLGWAADRASTDSDAGRVLVTASQGLLVGTYVLGVMVAVLLLAVRRRRERARGGPGSARASGAPRSR